MTFTLSSTHIGVGTVYHRGRSMAKLNLLPQAHQIVVTIQRPPFIANKYFLLAAFTGPRIVFQEGLTPSIIS